MNILRPFLATVLAAPLLVAAGPAAIARQYDGSFVAGLHWRSIGPYRGGRGRAVCGVPSRPNVLYMAPVNGGVWKTTDYGQTWKPIFDDQPTGSVGALAVAPSSPGIIYVGSGEGLQRPDLSTGDGIYKSTDEGRTWMHLGLRDGQQIPKVAVDPRDPTRLFVAVLGHPYGPNAERGIFRSIDGGATFDKVLYKDENTGGSDVEIDPSTPNVVYAALWEARQGPWENGAWSGTGGGLFKSTDGGTTWRPLTQGLPSGEDGVVQVDVTIAASRPSRLYATVATTRGTGIYRSDDAGESWTRVTNDPRPAVRIGGGDLPVPTADPANPDIVYSASVVAWKSTDGGKTWTGIRGAPGGDDYQQIWINPTNPDIMLFASDQGTIVTVNGGESWSSWYNQPTAAVYHVAIDTAYPYRVCSGQQDSGSVCISSRGNDGDITLREWHPVGVDEYGYAAPDPLDPDIVYGGRNVTRYDRRTGQVQGVGPTPVRSPEFRTLRTAPVLFSPVDPHVLYFAGNTLWKTTTGGRNWQQISPDLSRATWEVPATVAKYRDLETAKPTRRGVIYAVGPSYLDVNRIWAGTDDGLIHVTTDGGLHWTDVTPPALTPFAKVSIIDAGRFDVQTAYAAINTLRLDDLRPHIYRTHDGGRTWTHITNGIPDGATVNVVREDPVRKGLLFAGSEREVYASFDDGDHWQSLRLNMPASSVRDLVVTGDDLVAGTHGRGFWILDNITPLRQLDRTVAEADVVLFRPQVATRVRWDMYTDTPMPPDEPAGQNPPDGAIIDYRLKAAAAGPVTLEILDGAGAIVRRFSSADPVPGPDPNLAIPAYWVRPAQVLSADAGTHRFLWDLHYPPAPGARVTYPIAATLGNTAPTPSSPWVLPGTYSVRLTANGRSYTQPLAVRMDPRVKAGPADLAQQFTMSKHLYDGIVDVQAALRQVRGLRAQVKETLGRAGGGPVAQALAGFDQQAAALEGSAGAGFGGGAAAPGPDTLNSTGSALSSLLTLLQGADAAPTAQGAAAVTERLRLLGQVLGRWNLLKTGELSALNAQLAKAGLAPVAVPPEVDRLPR